MGPAIQHCASKVYKSLSQNRELYRSQRSINSAVMCFILFFYQPVYLYVVCDVRVVLYNSVNCARL